MYLKEIKNVWVEQVIVGTTCGVTIPVSIGASKCNALIDTGTMMCCMNEQYFQQLKLPPSVPLCRVTVQNVSGDSMGPLRMTKCQITMGGKNYAGEFVVCKYLKCSCIIGTDLLKKNAIYAGWNKQGKFNLKHDDDFLVKSIDMQMTGPMLYNKCDVKLAAKSIAVIETKADLIKKRKDTLMTKSPIFSLWIRIHK